MEIFIYISLSVLILSVIVFVSAPSMHRKHREATNGIVNHDPMVRKFVYKVELTRDEIIGILLSTKFNDKLTCTFDPDLSTITFNELLYSEKYYLVTEKQDSLTILKLEQIAASRRSQIKYKLNPFIVDKLNAHPLPFSEYEF